MTILGLIQTMAQIQFSVGTPSGVLAANGVKVDLVRVVRLATLILAFLLGLHHDIALALA
jgi:hypothetical protein